MEQRLAERLTAPSHPHMPLLWSQVVEFVGELMKKERVRSMPQWRMVMLAGGMYVARGEGDDECNGWTNGCTDRRREKRRASTVAAFL